MDSGKTANVDKQDVNIEKKRLRQKLQSSLLKLSDEQITQKSRQACKNLIATPQFQEASVIMMYLAIPKEVDTTEAILRAWQLGKTVAVPKVFWEHKHMIPVRINSMQADFSIEVSGLRNPVAGVPVPFEDIDLVVTPGLAFDKNGNRLGRGGGYYDKFFANNELNACRCGFAFIEQLIDQVPVIATDRSVDFLVTDSLIMNFNQNSE